MKFPIYVVNRKHTASFRIASLLLAITPLGLMLAAAYTSAHAQTSDDASLPGTSASTTSSPADWTQFHRDNMQRWNPYETVLGVGNVGNLQVKWKKPIGASGVAATSSPAVSNGVVYFGSVDLNVYALDASTGARLWRFATGDEVFSSPAVSNGVVYVGTGFRRANAVYALNASTGAKLWSYSTGGGVYSSPAVANGVVYIASTDSNVYALNASTGAVLWSYATGGAVYSSPAVANGVVYVGSQDNNVYALDANIGTVIWKYNTGYTVISGPAVANGVVYFGGGPLIPGSASGGVYALNASTGALLWGYSTGQFLIPSPAVANGVVYVGSNDENIYALNASTGAKLWSYHTASSVESSPAVANGVVYVGSDDGAVYAFNAGTGALLWKYFTGGGVDSSPAVVDGVLYILSGKTVSGFGNVYAFALNIANPADLFLRVQPSTTTVHQGDLITYAFPVWNLGPDVAEHEVLNTQVPAGTTFDYIRISGTPGLGTCTHPPYQGTGQIVCHENSAMAPNTTWTVRVTVKVTAPAGTVITANAATLADTPDPNLANNTASVSLTVQ